MSAMDGTTVDLVMDDRWEGLDYHRFFWERCRHQVAIQHLRVENGIFAFPGNNLLEYHEGADHVESYKAYQMILLWLQYRNNNNAMFRYTFAAKAEAMLFKLTFGGA